MHIVFGATELGASAAANAASSPRGRFQLDSLIRLFHTVSCANRDGSLRLFQVKRVHRALRVVHALRAVTCVEVMHVGRDGI